MTRGEAVALISQRLGSRSGLSTEIVAELNFQQQILERAPFLPTFLRKITAVVATASNPLAVPTGFLREVPDDVALWVTVEGVETPLTKRTYGELLGDEELRGTGQPTRYALVASNFYLFKSPDQAYAYTVVHYGADTILSSDASTNLWLTKAPQLLIARTGLQMAKALRAAEAVLLFAQDLQEAQAQLLHFDIAEEEAGQDAVMEG